MGFTPLIQIERASDVERKPDLRKRGCDACPLDKVKGVHKVMGKVRGRKIFIWAQSPGQQENAERKELLGRAGRFLWHELKRVGITRDMVDIQNVVRCIPANRREHIYPPLQMRAPSKEEIKCCSIYNERALEKSKAKLHLVFGQIAGKSLLKQEFKNDKRVFFSEKLNAWVVYLDHPAYFIRMGYEAGDNKAANAPLKRFRSDLDQAKKLLSRKYSDRFHYIKGLDSREVVTTSQAKKAYKTLKAEGEAGHRMVFDTEEGKLDKHGRPDDFGEWHLLCIGLQTTKTSYTFAVDHPDAHISRRCKRLNKRLLIKLLTNPRIEKSAHYATHDLDSVEKFLEIKVVQCTYDSLMGEYFYDCDAKAYGLERIAERRFPDFMGYKEIKYPDSFTEEYKKFLKTKGKKKSFSQAIEGAEKVGKFNLARLSWKKIVIYNGADCHLEKLVDRTTRKYTNKALMGVYIDGSRVLSRMQTDRDCLPVFDYDWCKKIKPIFKAQRRQHKKRLYKLLGGKTITYWKKGKKLKKPFNPGSPEQMYALVYDILKVKTPDDMEKNTQAKTILLLSVKHPKLKAVADWREADKALSMIESYENCANLNHGRLRTIWKTTGTRTGRLSSGKTKERTDDNVINFQNIHGDPLIKCLFVADRHWRDVYDYWLKHGDFTSHSWKKFEDYEVMLGYDFSQNELRQLAEEANDKELQKMFASGLDPHVEVGHAITGWAKEKIAHDDRVRKLVKNMQFGLVYGLAGEGLYKFIIARGVKTTLEEVMKYHAKYFKRFSGVKRLQDFYRNMVKKYGRVTNVFGFSRKLDVEAQQADDYEGAFWGNQAINTPIQGAAHQILMMCIAALHRFPEKYRLLRKLMMEIHDALYARIKLKYLMKGIVRGKELMVKEPVRIIEKEFHRKKRVPLDAKQKAGLRFGVQIEGVGEGELKHEYQFLNAWCRENQKLEASYMQQLRDLKAA